MFEVILPFPPSVNTYYRKVKNRIIISANGRKYQKACLKVLAPLRREPFAGDLSIELIYYLPDTRKRDADNYLKALFDSLEHNNIVKNDSQFREMRVAFKPKDPAFPRGCVFVVIRQKLDGKPHFPFQLEMRPSSEIPAKTVPDTGDRCDV